MILENQIEFYKKCAKVCEGDPNQHAECLQMAGWLQELKERREKEQREKGSIVITGITKEESK